MKRRFVRTFGGNLLLGGIGLFIAFMICIAVSSVWPDWKELSLCGAAATSIGILVWFFLASQIRRCPACMRWLDSDPKRTKVRFICRDYQIIWDTTVTIEM
jgi:hypothetical protein